MKKLVIFGTGSSAIKLVNRLDINETQILFFSDNDSSKHYKLFEGYKIYPPEHILKTDFDIVVIASQYSNEIMEQLINIGVPYSKIIPSDPVLHTKDNLKNYQEKLYSITETKNYNNDKIRIGLVNYNYSNYQGYALYKNIPDNIAQKYHIELIEKKDTSILKNYDVICSSHFDGIYDGNHINIELWHGFPLKQLGLIHKETVNDKFILNYSNKAEHIELIMSYSQLYTTFFNSCFPNNPSKYRVTGMPRNDLLFETGSKEKLEIVCNKEIGNAKIVFYLPTWRKGKNNKIETNKMWEQLFGFPDETEKNVVDIIEENNLFLVVKLHPFEYNNYKDLAIFKHERIALISDDMLEINKIHLYELLGCAEILLTDYSSIYFDTLLINLPIIFVQTDLEEYSKNRGFLVEPPSVLTPGPNVFSIEQLKIELEKYLSGIDCYKFHRDQVKKMVFEYDDNNSSVRVWEEIDKYLSNNNRIT